MPKGAIQDIKPRGANIEDVKSRNLELGEEVTRSYTVAHTAGVLMLTVPFITYSSAGTETQWSESGGVF